MELLTVREAAGLLKLSKSQVYTLCQRRVIPTIALGRSVRIPREALDRWLSEQIRPVRVENEGVGVADAWNTLCADNVASDPNETKRDRWRATPRRSTVARLDSNKHIEVPAR
jgi:excisionase family DNA binding protein